MVVVNPLPRPWQDQMADRQAHANNMFSVIQQQGNFNVNPDPAFDYASKAEQLGFQAQQAQAGTANNILTNAINSNSSQSSNGNVLPAGRFKNFLHAIAMQESGGNYNATNPSGALGKYQILGSNIAGPGGWDKQVLGYNITPQQFLHTPKYQEEIARAKLRNYFSQYGVRGAASAWYSGGPGNYKTNPGVDSYVKSILRRMGL